MSTWCGNDADWHDQRGFGDGHYHRDAVTWCSGRAPAPDLYTMEQAVILAKRALCESSDEGHDIGPTDGVTIRNANGIANGVVQRRGYGCSRCDLIVQVSYPPLVPAGRAA
jgi:transposase